MEKIKALQFFINPEIYKSAYAGDKSADIIKNALEIDARLKKSGRVKSTPEKETETETKC